MDEILCTIKLFGGPFVPHGYMECNGQLLFVEQYQAVYAILGNRYGEHWDKVRGKMSFGLPKLTPPNEHMKYIICVEGVFPERY